MLTEAIPPKMARTLETLGKTMLTEHVAVWKQMVQIKLNFVEKSSFPVLMKYNEFLNGM